jgi:protein-S-isoprenylcysteine O-methyltransferase Ste14
MSEMELLHLLGYIWAAFGFYWVVMAGTRDPSQSGEARFYRLLRLIVLAITFAFLLWQRTAIRPFTLIVLSFIWAALGLYWAGSVTDRKPAQSQESRLYRVMRLVILAITFALLFWDRTAIGILGRRFVPESPAIAYASFAITLAGLAIALWARLHLGQYWSDKVVLQIDHQLIRSGPYAYMRHPIYSGVLLGVAGTALLLGEWRGVLAFALLLTNYAIKAKKEERILSTRFGGQFQDQMRRAGFLLPRLRARN